MIRVLLFLFLNICAGSTIYAFDPYNGVFEPGKPSQYVKWAKYKELIKLKPEAKQGKYCLVLENGKENSLIIHPVSVNPDKKYHFSFYAKINGPDTLEENPQIEYLFVQYNKKKAGRILPGWKIIFLNSEGKRIKHKHPQFFTTIMHDEWTLYQERFYPPSGAVKMEVRFLNGSKENTLSIDNMKMEELSNDETINVNSAFELGIHNYSGWNYIYQSEIIEDPEKKNSFIMDCQNGWVIGDNIPVKTSSKYTIQYKMTGNNADKKAVLQVRFLNKEYKQIDRVKKAMKAAYGETAENHYTFSVPSESAYMQITIGYGKFYYIRINKNNNKE